MGQTIFYPGLDSFCRTYMLANRQVTPIEAVQFPGRMKEEHGALFEQLMLFDKVNFKVHGENIGLPLLIGLLGRETLEDLIDQDAIGFTLWTPLVTHLVADNPAVYPLQFGTHSSPAHSDPEQSVELGLGWMKNQLSRRERRRLIKRVVPLYTLPERELSRDAVSITTSAYTSGKLKVLNVPSTEKDIRNLTLSERATLNRCATELLEYSFLIKHGMTSFSNRNYFALFEDSAAKVQAQPAVAGNFNRLAELEGFPDLKTLHTELKDPFKQLARLRAKNNTVRFRKWLSATTFSDMDTDITKEYIDSIAERKGFFETKKGKITKSVVMTAIGTSIGAALGGVEGAVGGAVAAKGLEAGVEFTLDLVDEFLINGITKGWSPRMFFDDLSKVRGKNSKICAPYGS